MTPLFSFQDPDYVSDINQGITVLINAYMHGLKTQTG